MGRAAACMYLLQNSGLLVLIHALDCIVLNGLFLSPLVDSRVCSKASLSVDGAEARRLMTATHSRLPFPNFSYLRRGVGSDLLVRVCYASTPTYGSCSSRAILVLLCERVTLQQIAAISLAARTATESDGSIHGHLMPPLDGFHRACKGENRRCAWALVSRKGLRRQRAWK